MNDEIIQSSLQTLRTIVGALIVSQVTYVLIGVMLITNMNFDFSDVKPLGHIPENMFEILFIVFIVAGFFTVLASYMIPKLIMSKNASYTQPLDSFMNFRKAKLLQHVILDSIGIYGLVLALLTANLYSFVFMGVAIILHVAFFPYTPNDAEMRE